MKNSAIFPGFDLCSILFRFFSFMNKLSADKGLLNKNIPNGLIGQFQQVLSENCKVSHFFNLKSTFGALFKGNVRTISRVANDSLFNT